MKRFFILTILFTAVLVTSCSKIEENDNPIIGIWNDMSLSQAAKSSENINNEWTFNDAYLGRYHRYENDTIVFKTDFRWSEENGVYTISYPGTDLPVDIVSMMGSLDGDMLEYKNGSLLAKRE